METEPQATIEPPAAPPSELAQEIAAQAWCQPDACGTIMDPALCMAFARMLDPWIQTAAEYADNAEFYRNLLDQCAVYLGEAAYRADDGSMMESPIRLKIPQLVAALARRHQRPNPGDGPMHPKEDHKCA